MTSLERATNDHLIIRAHELNEEIQRKQRQLDSILSELESRTEGVKDV